MTIDHPIRRFLARVCTDDTMARVVDPTLADLRVEDGRLTWRGAFTLVRALTLHTLASLPGSAGHVWRDDNHAIPRAASFTMLVAVVTALALVTPPLAETRHLVALRLVDKSVFEILIRSVLLLLPQALVLTLGPSLLFALPVAFGKKRPSATLARRTIALAFACMLATTALFEWAMPEANQAFRAFMSGDMHLTPGPNEMSFGALRELIVTLQLTPGGIARARSLEFLLHVRIAFICAPLAFAVLGLAVAGTAIGRRRPLLTGLTGIGFYVFVMYPLLFLGERLVSISPLPAGLLAWIPIIAVVVLAATIRRIAPAVVAADRRT